MPQNGVNLCGKCAAAARATIDIGFRSIRGRASSPGRIPVFALLHLEAYQFLFTSSEERKSRHWVWKVEEKKKRKRQEAAPTKTTNETQTAQLHFPPLLTSPGRLCGTSGSEGGAVY